MKDTVAENYAVVKGDNALLNRETEEFFKGVRRTEYGFEALTDDAQEAKNRFGKDVVIETADLEDIMYLSKLRSDHD